MASGIGGPVSSPLQPPKDVNTGDHSEAMFHRLDDFKRMMAGDRMGFLYQRWVAHPCADPARAGQWRTQGVWGENNLEREDTEEGGLWQLKVINFGFIWEARGRLANLHTSGDALKGAADQVVQRINAAWTSKAGEKAAGKFTELRDASGEYATALQTLTAQIEGAWRTTRQAVDDLANFATKSDIGGKPMMDRYGGTGASNDDGNGERGDWSSRIDGLNQAMQYGTWEYGPEAHEIAEDTWGPDLGWGVKQQNGASLRRPGEAYIEADGSNMWSNEICNWLDDMAHCYYLTIKNFRDRVEQTISTVSQAWEKLNEESRNVGALDPFGKLALGPGQGTDDKKPPGGDGRDPGKDRRGTGGTDTGGTDTGGTPPPPPPVPPVDTGTDPADAGGAGTEPVVEPPVPGQDPAKQAETVTIEDGDRKVSVQSPDGQGHVKVTVDDGTGNPQTYDMDFGAGTGTDPTAGGAPVPGPGQTLPGQPTGGAHTLPAPADGSSPVGQDPSGTEQVEHVQAGPDGKAVVHDGDVTITAERPPGSPDQVRITVDDGTGNPQTYLVDYSDESGATAQPVPADRAAAQGGDFAQRLTSEAHAFADSLRGDGGGVASAAQQAGFTEPVGSATGPQLGFTPPGENGFTQPGFTEPGQPAAPPAGFTEPGADPAAGQADPGQAAPQHARYSGSSGFTDLFTDWSSGTEAQQAASEAAWTEPEPSGATSVQAAGFDLDTEDSSGMDGMWSTQGDLFGDDTDDTDDGGGHGDTDDGGQQIAPSAGEAGVATVPDNGPNAAGAATAAGGMGGGMPMMGGMAGGGGGGGNTDQERGPSAWTTTGDLFDDGPVSAADRISAVLDDDR